MSLSDCERCWDTPCHCGNDGYVAVYPSTKEGAIKLKALKHDAYGRVLSRLRVLLDEILSEETP